MGALRVAVLGCGNSLAGDDAVGLEVLAELARCYAADRCPHLEVELIEVGTGGLDVIEHILDRDRVIIVDAVLAGRPRGEVVEVPPGAMPEPDQVPFSLHGINVADAVAMARKLYPGRMPDPVQVVGVEIGERPKPFVQEMSGEVREAVEPACRCILDTLDDWSEEVSSLHA